jgi:hypothetical protein
MEGKRPAGMDVDAEFDVLKLWHVQGWPGECSRGSEEKVMAFSSLLSPPYY